ncbi:hypothetical protein TKK_0009193 [Trichogramma kaykai]
MSEYVKNLTSDIRLRYCDKVTCINSIDPYTITKEMFSEEKSEVPKVELVDIMTYFVLTHNVFSAKQIKAYNSLEAYKYYTSGFVHSVKHVKINNYTVVLSNVKHSQKMNEKDLKPWIILFSNGSIKTAHCTCMAGLGEACSHVAATLFYIYCHENDSLSCTDKLSTWKVPKTAKKVEFKQVQDKHWGKKCQSYDDTLPKNIIPLEGNRLDQFLNKIHGVTPNAVIFSALKPHVKNDANEQTPMLPQPLGKVIFPVELQKMTLDQLRRIPMTIKFSKEQRDSVFEATLNRSNLDVLYEYQAGRITASTFYKTCIESIDDPSLTLIKSICYPAKISYKLSNKTYQAAQKLKARTLYMQEAADMHVNHLNTNPGLLICERHPYFAAISDALVMCDCCDGQGCIEIKSPYELKNQCIEEFVKNNKFPFFKKTCDGYELNKTHEYYYQVQFQMYCANHEYCDFILCSNKKMIMHRITIDKDFLETQLLKSKSYYDNVIVPELIGKYYTREKDPNRSVEWMLN